MARLMAPPGGGSTAQERLAWRLVSAAQMYVQSDPLPHGFPGLYAFHRRLNLPMVLVSESVVADGDRFPSTFLPLIGLHFIQEASVRLRGRAENDCAVTSRMAQQWAEAMEMRAPSFEAVSDAGDVDGPTPGDAALEVAVELWRREGVDTERSA